MTRIVKSNITNPYFDIFNNFFNESSESTKMKTDIIDTENAYELQMDIPGFNKEDIKIALDKGYLTVTVSKTEETVENEVKYLRRERFSGSYERSFYVGDEIADEDIKASFTNGTLTLNVPKVGSKKVETKYIDIL